ncbi:hypothetical protein N866_14660 [Actinotalea ferrariae CF5-4]|uniref:Uncharacterized protein n=2 Tax=Actinotalea TaxID=458839 RepID=A0A021VS55_9CELL|nr:hypothetical protein N866_14660 [Actinotalea ferrariae CF5-4]
MTKHAGVWGYQGEDWRDESNRASLRLPVAAVDPADPFAFALAQGVRVYDVPGMGPEPLLFIRKDRIVFVSSALQPDERLTCAQWLRDTLA